MAVVKREKAKVRMHLYMQTMVGAVKYYFFA